MAIWTENEVYLGYALLKFVKIVTTEKLKGLLNMSPTATLTIHNVEYTGHPLELALLLNYCIICNTSKTIYLVIHNEDTGFVVPSSDRRWHLCRRCGEADIGELSGS